jgi:hypothetical protein
MVSTVSTLKPLPTSYKLASSLADMGDFKSPIPEQ